MRRFGTILMVIGGFVIVSAVFAVIGPTLEAGGINVTGFVSSIPGALLTGAALIFIGAVFRRRALATNREKK
jgi:hypothetical protein